MARQIQIRRGTATEHNAFTGAIGEVTMDTTNNTLRVHDGETIGGTVLAKKNEIPDLTNVDYVVETQAPTEDNSFTWYRKYKSGWVEQGGQGNIPSTELTVHFPVRMAHTSYCYQATGARSDHPVGIQMLTTTSMRLDYASTATGIANWYVCGMSDAS